MANPNPRETRYWREVYWRRVDFESQVINETRVLIATTSDPEVVASLHEMILRHSISLLLFRYQRGDDWSELAKSWLALYDTLHPAFVTNASAYPGRHLFLLGRHTETFHALWLLAFGIALHRPSSELKMVTQCVGSKDGCGLWQRIVAHTGLAEAEKIYQPASQKVPFELLVEIIDSSAEQRALKMRRYLKRWYTALRKTPWYEMHRRPDGWEFTGARDLYESDEWDHAYAGYWSFEAALITMLCDIDDSSYKGHPNYPAELVEHYRTGIHSFV